MCRVCLMWWIVPLVLLCWLMRILCSLSRPMSLVKRDVGDFPFRLALVLALGFGVVSFAHNLI